MSSGWNTIESDAGVFTYLIQKLGVQGVQFEELLTLDSDSLLQLSPVHGLIFLFKYPTKDPPTSTDPSKPLDGTFDHDAASNLFFANQVIQNACGTQALLSVLLNKDSASHTPGHGIDIGAPLRDFKDFTFAFPPDIRGETLSNSELIRDTHNSFARSAPFIDETVRQASEDEDVYHFIAYAPLAGQLYELDGLQPAPISHGPCKTTDEDAGADFSNKIVEVLQRRMQRYGEGEVRFNLMALCGDLREKARSIGDSAGVEREEAKRRAWTWENALRRCNFLGFAGKVLEGVVSQKVRQGEYEKWVEEAVGRTRTKYEARKAGKEALGADEMDVGA